MYYANLENNKFLLPGRLRINITGLKNNRNYAQNINRCLSKTEGISFVNANAYTGKALVIFDMQKISIREVEAAIVKALDFNIDKPCENKLESINDGKKDNQLRKSSLLLATAGISITGLLFKHLFYGKSSLAKHGGVFAVAASATVITGYPALREKIQVKQGNGKILSSLNFTAFVCLILRESTLGLFVAIVGFLSEVMHKRINKEFEQTAIKLLENQNSTIYKISGNREEKVQGSALLVGDRIRLNAGDFVPVDGVVIQGRAVVDNTLLDGQSAPHYAQRGSNIYAGTVVEEGEILLDVTATGVETRYYQAFNSSIQALEKELNAEEVFAKKHRALMPYIIFASALGLAITGDILILLAIFLIACPAPASFGANIALKAAVLRAFANRIFIKKPAKLSVISRVDAMLFDKTGTITTAKPEVTEIVTFGAHTADFVLGIAAVCERNNRHPIAIALKEAARNRQLDLKEACRYDHRPGKGVVCFIGQREAMVGNRKLLHAKHIPLKDYTAYEKRFEQAGLSCVYVAHNHKIIGIIALRERLRENIVQSISKLVQDNIREIEVVSGDQERIVKNISNQAGIKNYSVSSSPEGKVQRVIEYQQAGKTVAFVGDGINDCAAMQRSDVAVAFADRPEKNVFGCADVVLLDSKINAIPELVELSRFTMDNIEKNYRLSFLLNIIGVMLVLSGNFSPYFASFYKDLNSLIILARSLEPARYKINILSKQVN